MLSHSSCCCMKWNCGGVQVPAGHSCRTVTQLCKSQNPTSVACIYAMPGGCNPKIPPLQPLPLAQVNMPAWHSGALFWGVLAASTTTATVPAEVTTLLPVWMSVGVSVCRASLFYTLSRHEHTFTAPPAACCSVIFSGVSSSPASAAADTSVCMPT